MIYKPSANLDKSTCFQRQLLSVLLWLGGELLTSRETEEKPLEIFIK